MGTLPLFNVGLLLVFAFGLPSGCSREDTPDKPVGDEELVRVENAVGASAYYAGRSFAGLALTHAESQGAGTALFVYGSCEIDDPGGFEGGSCEPPIQIQVFPFDPNAWASAVGCHRRPSLRGVPTVRHDGLVLFTVRTVVKIYARSSAEEGQVARALRSLDGRVDAGADLPPPAFNVEKALARCG